jgi:hypothetical protein
LLLGRYLTRVLSADFTALIIQPNGIWRAVDSGGTFT